MKQHSAATTAPTSPTPSSFRSSTGLSHLHPDPPGFEHRIGLEPRFKVKGAEKRPDYGRLARAESVPMTPQRPVGSCCRECRFENALDVATSAKCSLRPVASSPVDSGYCAQGSGYDLGDGARGAGSCGAS